METRLIGRTTPGVELVGNTVRRPTGAHSAFVHAVLRHLHARGFAGAPSFLGVDPNGRELLSYLPGEVPPDLQTFSIEQLASAARLLRALHDATSDFAQLGPHEVVCHGDASPCNCVFRDGLPYAFIDFDAAHLGTRLEDAGYAAWLWLQIGEPIDPVDQGGRLGAFFEDYGVAASSALAAVEAAQAELSTRHGAPAATREWARDCLHWSRSHHAAMDAGLARVRRLRSNER